MANDKIVNILNDVEFYYLTSIARKIHGPYFNGNGDRQIGIIVEDDGSRRTVSWPKLLIEEHLGRKLDPDKETIDHLNRDHNDNRLENLRIVPRDLHSADDTRRVKMIELTCDVCGKKFERSPRLIRDKSKKGKRSSFCSRSCAGKYSRQLQLKQINKLKPLPQIKSIYYRKDKSLEDINSLASVKYLINKYS